MDKKNEETLIKIREAVSATIQEHRIELSNPNRNNKIYSEKVIEEINRQIKENKLPIMYEDFNGERVLLEEARLVHIPEQDTANIISISLVGRIQKPVSIDFNIGKENIKL